MKKLLIQLMVILTLMLIAGCSNPANMGEKSGSTESPTKAEELIEDASTDVQGSETKEWPTEQWNTSTPEEQGLDSKLLSDSDKRINENYPNVYSLLVVRHGYLVYEKYYQGNDRESYNPVFSVTKSVMSALTGIAIREKLIKGVDQKVSDFLPDYFENIDDVNKKDITLYNALTMTGGLESIDSNFYAYEYSADWLDFALKEPLVDKPGEKFAYNTGLPHFLSAIITNTSKMSTLDFADKYLFNQIGVSVEQWEMDRKGYYGGGVGLYMKAEDMAKFGYLYLNNGLWDGKQIIPKEWVSESTKKHIEADSERDYGYLFWLQDIKDKIHNKTYSTISADGYGGQKIVVVPELDMVVVITANAQSSSIDKTDDQDIIWDYVLPAVK